MELIWAIFRPLLFIGNLYQIRIRTLPWIEWHALFLRKKTKNFRPIRTPGGEYGNFEKNFFSDNRLMIIGFNRAFDADYNEVVGIENQLQIGGIALILCLTILRVSERYSSSKCT